MIITGIVIVAVCIILMILSLLGGMIGGATSRRHNEDVWVVSGVLLYVLFGIGYVVGLALIAIGIVEALIK